MPFIDDALLWCPDNDGRIFGGLDITTCIQDEPSSTSHGTHHHSSHHHPHQQHNHHNQSEHDVSSAQDISDVLEHGENDELSSLDPLCTESPDELFRQLSENNFEIESLLSDLTTVQVKEENNNLIDQDVTGGGISGVPCTSVGGDSYSVIESAGGTATVTLIRKENSIDSGGGGGGGGGGSRGHGRDGIGADASTTPAAALLALTATAQTTTTTTTTQLCPPTPQQQQQHQQHHLNTQTTSSVGVGVGGGASTTSHERLTAASRYSIAANPLLAEKLLSNKNYSATGDESTTTISTTTTTRTAVGNNNNSSNNNNANVKHVEFKGEYTRYNCF